MTAPWLRVNGLLLHKREIQQVLNARFPSYVSRQEQKALIAQKSTKSEWECLMIKYGAYSDSALREELAKIDAVLDYELDIIYIDRT